MPIGELLSLLSAALMGLGGLFVRRGQRRRGPDNGIFMSVVSHFVIVSVVTAVALLTQPFPPLVLGGVAIFVVAGLLTSFMGRAAYFASVQRIGPSRAVGYRVTSPAFTLVVAILLLNEQLELLPLLGFLCILVGLWFLSRETAGPIPGSKAVARDAVPFRPQAGQSRLGILFGMAAAASLGSGHALRKVGLAIIPSPLVGSWISGAVALSGVVATFGVRGTLRALVRSNFSPLRRDYLVGGTLISLGQLGIFFAFSLAPVSLAAVIASTEPVWVLAFSRVILGAEEHLTLKGVGAILVICAGVAVILAS